MSQPRSPCSPDSLSRFVLLARLSSVSLFQNDYGSEELKKVGAQVLERERTTGLSESAQASVAVCV